MDDEDDNTIVVDPDAMYDDDGNVIDISKFERVKKTDLDGGGGGCNMGCRNGGDGAEDEEEKAPGLLDGLPGIWLPSLPSFGGGGGSGEDGAVGDFTPIIVVSVLGGSALSSSRLAPGSI